MLELNPHTPGPSRTPASTIPSPCQLPPSPTWPAVPPNPPPHPAQPPLPHQHQGPPKKCCPRAALQSLSPRKELLAGSWLDGACWRKASVWPKCARGCKSWQVISQRHPHFSITPPTQTERRLGSDCVESTRITNSGYCDCDEGGARLCPGDQYLGNAS